MALPTKSGALLKFTYINFFKVFFEILPLLFSIHFLKKICCKYLFTANIYHQHSIEHCLIFLIKTNKASKKHLNEIV